MKILSKQILSNHEGVRVVRIEVLSPHIAQKAQPGQFVVVMAQEKGERIPLTIVETYANKGSIALIFQEAGLTSRLLSKLNEGDSLHALVGPLGHATEIRNYGKVIMVGGGVGIAEIYPVAKALKAAGNHITTIVGVRSKPLLILEDELKASSDALCVTTDDGSYGRRGFVTEVLQGLLAQDSCNLVYAVGPIPMMKRVAAVTKEFDAKTIVSLNALMVDGTGMCGSCRVNVAGQVKFACIDGPEFDAHLIDWQTLEQRNAIYLEKEKHICKLLQIS